MLPLILPVNKKKCYVIYANQLFINVPAKKVDACLEAHNAGKTTKGVNVFTMDSRFNMRYADKEARLIFGDAATPKKVVIFENVADKYLVIEWLKPYLSGNNFKISQQPVATAKLWLKGGLSIALVIFIFAMLYDAAGSTVSPRSNTKTRLFVQLAHLLGQEVIIGLGAVCLIVALVYTIRLVKKGDTQIIYSK